METPSAVGKTEKEVFSFRWLAMRKERGRRTVEPFDESIDPLLASLSKASRKFKLLGSEMTTFIVAEDVEDVFWVAEF
jgi:hypothetical protein